MSAVEEAVRQLSLSRPELGITAEWSSDGISPEPVATSTKLLECWLDETASLAAGIDRRTAAAYLLSILVWRLGEILAHLYLSGAPTLELDADDIRPSFAVTDNGRSRAILVRVHLAGYRPMAPLQRDVFVSSVIAVHQPLVDGLSRKTGLSKQALWRLVTDGITNGFLVWGKLTGRLDFAKSEAACVVSVEPLHNRQWQFAEAVGASGRREWCCLRGGCCRLYRSEGGEYCANCVLRNRDDQMLHLAAGL